MLLEDGHLREAGELGATVGALVLNGHISGVLRHAVPKGHREATDAHGLGAGITDVALKVLLVAHFAVNAVNLVSRNLAHSTAVN